MSWERKTLSVSAVNSSIVWSKLAHKNAFIFKKGLVKHSFIPLAKVVPVCRARKSVTQQS